MEPDPSSPHIGDIEKTDKMGTGLHEASKGGHTRRLKRILDKGIKVDYPNSSGQSPLFLACYHNQFSAVKILLKRGANPNERSLDGATPVHAACYSCNMKILSRLLGVGGDLRLHDNLSRTPRDYIMLQSDPKRKYRMLEFIEKTRCFAMTGSSRESVKMQTSMVDRAAEQANSVIRFVRNKIRGDSSITVTGEAKSVQSLGYGKVYLDNESWHGMISLVPLVAENCLRHDNGGFTYNNGSFMVMESMTWADTEITVKRLHRKLQEGGHVDLLINESEFMGKVHHPNVLVFMGICQTNNLEGLVLLYERVGCGSLFHYLHERFEKVSFHPSLIILRQICCAIMFLHQQNLIHCSITSHAINMISPTFAKLGNFEYMVERCEGAMQKNSSVTTNTTPNAVYNWLAPELMEDKPPVFMSDMYSFCMVMYEIYEDKIPWDDCSSTFIKQKLILEGYSVSHQSPNIPRLAQLILGVGLRYEPSERKLLFERVHHLLTHFSQQNPSKELHSYSDSGSIENASSSNLSDKQLDSDINSSEPYKDTSEPDNTSPKEGTIDQGQRSIINTDIPSFDLSNNSSSDYTQTDEADGKEICNTSVSTNTSKQTKTKHVQIIDRRDTHSSKGKLVKKRSKLSRGGSVQMYRDNENAFHYSVCLPERSPQKKSPLKKTSISSASTLPRCKKETFKNKPLTDSASSDITSVSANVSFKEQSAYSTVSKSPEKPLSISLPSVAKQADQGSPSALYKAVTFRNNQAHSVEIVRDIKAELANEREKRNEHTAPGPFRSQTLSTASSFRSDASPTKFNYMTFGAQAKVASVPLKPEVLEAMKKRKQILSQSTLQVEPKDAPDKEQLKNKIFQVEGPEVKQPKSPKKSPDKRWYGGMGSVKNLVKKYQEQAEETIAHQPADIKSEECGPLSIELPNQDKRLPVVQSCRKEDAQAVETYRANKRSYKSPTDSETDKYSVDSQDSEEILEWVNYHLERIKKDIVFGVTEQSEGMVIDTDSCDLIVNEVSDASILSTEKDMKIEVLPNTDSGSSCNNIIDVTFSKGNGSETQSQSSSLMSLEIWPPKTRNGTSSNTETFSGSTSQIEKSSSSEASATKTQSVTVSGKAEPEEFYFDDEIQPSLLHTKHLKLQGTSSVPNYSSELHAVTDRGRTLSQDRKEDLSHHRSKKGSNLVSLRKQLDQPPVEHRAVSENQHGDQGDNSINTPSERHTTVVSVRSSRTLPGKHTITHTEIDEKTGKAETINRGTVRAKKIVSKVYSK